MHRLYRAGAAALTVLLLGSAQAQSSVSTPPETAPASETPPAPPAPAASAPKFEGAIGLVLSIKPAFSGSSDRKLSPQLAGFLRYGRWTITGAGGFTTQRQDDVERGLDAELVRRENVRVNLSLRYDPGRRESASGELAGMGNIKATVRARLGLRWSPAPLWGVSLAGTGDMLGNGGGNLADAGVSRTFVIDARQRVIVGAGMTVADGRYMQTWYGVTAQQSAASGYPVYEAKAGLRDIGTNVTWRIEVDRHWAGFTSAGFGRLLGPAADSPLTRQANNLTISAGIARRF